MSILRSDLRQRLDGATDEGSASKSKTTACSYRGQERSEGGGQAVSKAGGCVDDGTVPHAYVLLRADFFFSTLSVTLCGAPEYVPCGAAADEIDALSVDDEHEARRTRPPPDDCRKGPQPLVCLRLIGTKGHVRFRPRSGGVGVQATVQS